MTGFFYIPPCRKTFPAWRNVKYQHGRGTTNRGLFHFPELQFSRGEIHFDSLLLQCTGATGPYGRRNTSILQLSLPEAGDEKEKLFQVQRSVLCCLLCPGGLLLQSSQLGRHNLWIRARDNSGVRILKLLRSPRIDSKEPIPPDCVVWRAGTTTLFLSPIDCLKIPAQEKREKKMVL